MAGIHGYDISKLSRKFDTPVDFDRPLELQVEGSKEFDMIVKNMDYVNSLLK